MDQEIIKSPSPGDNQTPKPLQLLVKRQLSLLLSKRQTENTCADDVEKIQTLKTYLPTQIAKAYPPEMQRVADGAFPTILTATEHESAPRIEQLAAAHGDRTAIGWIQQQLVMVAKFAGAKNTLTDDQLVELAPQIRYKYGFLNLAEFILFCARLRAGEYETFYGSVDPMAILKSLATFCQQRFIEKRDAYQKREKERAEKERDEHDKQVMAFRQWYRNLSDEEKAEYNKQWTKTK